MDILARINKFNRDLVAYCPYSLIYSYFDLAVSALMTGSSFDDYIRYRFWEKSMYCKKQFITYKRSKRNITHYNAGECRHVFSNKPDFNQTFSKYIKRNWLDLATADIASFEDFTKEHSRFIAKPRNGGQGKGVSVINRDDICNKDYLAENRSLLVESLIVQHPEMSKLNPSSVNTIRIVSFNHKGSIQLIAASLRTGGADSCVDNLHSGGVCASIDIDTGIVFTEGIDYKYKKHVTHPVTGAQIVGFVIPNWQAIKNVTYDCAKVVAQIGYVGWDIAVLPEGCEVIEGNHDPGHDVIQMIDQIGKYSFFK